MQDSLAAEKPLSHKTRNVLRKSRLRVSLGPESQPQLGVTPAKWEGAQPWAGPRSGKRSYLDKAGPPTPAPLPSMDLCWDLQSVHDAADHTGTSMRLWQSPFL